MDVLQSLKASITVPKNRRPKFELTLKIIDLNNVPLVSGTSFIKWHLPSSTSAEHRGRTPKCPIKEHKVTWDYEKTVQLRLTADKSGLLQDTEINLEVLQEYSSGARGETIVLGNIKLNLPEYAYIEAGEDGEHGVTRRYLMQDSKINSTLKTSIAMKQLDGDRNFIAPPLKTAPIFGGIAGIITSEQSDPADSGSIPSLSSTLVRDQGELQDMYRRTLAASWTSQLHELPADECIEDIFSGGDGWGKHKPTSLNLQPTHLQVPSPSSPSSSSAAASFASSATAAAKKRDDSDEPDSGKDTPPSSALLSASSQRSAAHRRTPSHPFRRGPAQHLAHARAESRGEEGGAGAAGAAASGEALLTSSSEQGRRPHRARNEVSDFEVREDLRSWEISAGGED